MFEDDSFPTQKDALAIDCANLLGAMELEVEEADDEVLEDESSLMLPDDNEKIQLPDEWIYDLQAKNQSFLDKDIDSNSSELLQQDKQALRNENSQLTEKHNDSVEDLAWTQPSDEVLERHQVDDSKEKTKKLNKKQQWGPMIPLRRSSRRVDDGKKVMECAQEFKRKWYLEDNAGISKKPPKPHPVSKNLLLSVAKDIGIDVEDGHPILDKMVQLYFARMGDMLSEGSHAGCSSKAVKSSLGS